MLGAAVVIDATSFRYYAQHMLSPLLLKKSTTIAESISRDRHRLLLIPSPVSLDFCTRMLRYLLDTFSREERVAQLLRKRVG